MWYNKVLILYKNNIILGEFQEYKNFERINVNSLECAFEELDKLQLCDVDYVLFDLDGTLRREGMDLDSYSKFTMVNRLQAWGVRHGIGIRTPDVVDSSVWERMAKIEAKKAIVTDNTSGGHVLTSPWAGRRWFERALIYPISIFSIDSPSVERNEGKGSLALLVQRFRYLDALLMQFVIGIPLGVLSGRNKRSECIFDNRYKAIKGRNAKAVGDLLNWISSQKIVPCARIVMVGDEETDFQFFKKLMELVSAQNPDVLIHAFYVNLGQDGG